MIKTWIYIYIYVVWAGPSCKATTDKWIYTKIEEI